MSSAELPLVTIITPTYNAADYICETIDSVLSQDYPNLEYIVLNDGSKDNTLELLEKYKDQLTLETHPNVGETRTVNKGFEMAKGEYVIVVSADDPILPDMIEKEVAFMADHPDVIVGYPGWLMIDQDSEVIRKQPMFEYDYLHMIRWHYCLAGPGTIIRRKAFQYVAGRDPSYTYVADYAFWMRLGLYGDFAYIPEVLATWRVHPASTSSSKRGKAMAEEHIRLFNELYMSSELPQEVKDAEAEAMSVAYFVAGSTCVDVAPFKAIIYYIRSLMWCASCPKSYPSGLNRSWKYMIGSIWLSFKKRLT